MFEKYIKLNSISKHDLLKHIGVQEIKELKNHSIGDKHRNMLTLDGIENSNEGLFGIDLKIFNQQNISKITNRLSTPMFEQTKLFRTNLTWCEDCMKYGYHSLLHQFELLKHCPFHLNPLKQACPHCHAKLPYSITDKGYSGSFLCECGFAISDSHFENWRYTPTVVCKDTQSWLNESNFKSKILIFIPESIFNVVDPLKLIVHTNRRILKTTEIYIKAFNNDQLHLNEMNKHISGNISVNYNYSSGFFNRLFESTKNAFKGINSYLRKTVLESHMNCTDKVCQKTNEPCFYIWAYNHWLRSLFGSELNFRNVIVFKDHGRLHEFSVTGIPYKNDLYKLYRAVLTSLHNDFLDKSIAVEAVIKWIIAGAAANYYLQGFYSWLDAAKQLMPKTLITLADAKEAANKKLPIFMYEYVRIDNKIKVSLVIEDCTK